MVRMDEAIRTRCCIAGGGPAGMILALLLARMGVDVVVLEKHADFLRDFRGDTVHPSTLELMHELHILDAFLKLPRDTRAFWSNRERDGSDCGLHAPPHSLPVCGIDAAVGLPRFH